VFGIKKSSTFAVVKIITKNYKFMEKTIKSKSSNFVARTRKECPENLSKAGKWMLENPNGIAIIVNRRAVNK